MRLIALLLLTCIGMCRASADYSDSHVIKIDEYNWRDILKDEWLVEFYAPWCPACKNLARTWDDFAKWTSSVGVSAGKVDVTESPALSGRFFVTALPTIFHVIDGEFRQYRGPRDLESFKSYITERKWEKYETVSAWTRPDSIQMSIVSYFFKFSHILKEVNNDLLTHYGLPTWATYVLFAIATILFGAILGLLLVCIIDLISPPKSSTRHSFNEVQNEKEEAGDDISGDDLEDENDIENADETSDGERNSQSDSDEAQEDAEVKSSPPGSPGKTTDEVRKRRTRKAD